MKYEWRKKEKHIYIPKQKPEITSIEKALYLTIEGEGNPNSDNFADAVQALYSLSYGIKMAPKKKIEIKNYYDYTVFPLEGEWNLSLEGAKLYESGKSIVELKDFLTYKVMIKQPTFITQELLDRIKIMKPNILNKDVHLEEVEDGLVCQMLHVGSYDDEPESFNFMELFCEEQGYQRLHKHHKEIYLSDPRKVSKDKLKTTLRLQVRKK